ncbi:MAG: hypothetical protein H7282_05115 [Cytophagaceae bacterium]|nr:hypothetical protein [Cytophagaceae bacterium]
MKDKKTKVLEHLKARPWISIFGLESELGIPTSTLAKSLSPTQPRNLPDKYVEPLADKLGINKKPKKPAN